MIVYTFPVEMDRKIIVPSKPIQVVEGGKLETIEVGEAVRVEDAEMKTTPTLLVLRTVSGDTFKEFDRIWGTIQPNPRGKLLMSEAQVVEVWQRRV